MAKSSHSSCSPLPVILAAFLPSVDSVVRIYPEFPDLFWWMRTNLCVLGPGINFLPGYVAPAVFKDYISKDRKDHISKGLISKGHISKDHISKDHISKDHISKDHIRKGHTSKGHISKDHINSSLNSERFQTGRRPMTSFNDAANNATTNVTSAPASTTYYTHPVSVFLETYYSVFLLAFGTVGNLLSFAVLSRRTFRFVLSHHQRYHVGSQAIITGQAKLWGPKPPS
ncbi:hypothetical protein Btru_001441 [Bulinus truncatus]|nr:hypothetical protein Btru_001441 [Bulinus truncatus]